MDPRTGGIYALANYPTFDPNHYSNVEPKTWVNPASSEIYEPGSVFKVVTMSAALDAGRITPDTLFEDNGALNVDGQVIHNAQNAKYGLVTATQALAHSINVVSAQMSLGMGPEVFYSYLRRFGFSKLTELDLKNESAGIVKERGQADWSTFDEATNSFGQGISVTPIQMINAVAAIANRGVLLQPHLVEAMVQDGQVHYMPPHIIGRPVKPDTALKMKDMMVYDVTSSSYAKFLPGYQVAGKTGTAEIPTPQGYVLSTSITSFLGFLPADNPQLVIMVKLDKPLKSRWAEQVAVPVFGKVATEAIRILGISPN
jgi:cell division protein FtsI/penicillin-binding protein 2